MRKYETRTRKPREEVLVSQQCDWCKEDMDVKRNETRMFECKYAVETSSVSGFMDGAVVTRLFGWKVEDICDECAAKLERLLNAAGVRTKPFVP